MGQVGYEVPVVHALCEDAKASDLRAATLQEAFPFFPLLLGTLLSVCNTIERARTKALRNP